MAALIRKDCYTLYKKLRWSLLLIAIWSATPNNTFFNSFAIIYMVLLPYTAMEWDEKSKWDQLAKMMPYTDKEIVLSKYVLGWLLIGGSTIWTILVQGILSTANPSVWHMAGMLIFSNVCIALTATALSLPLMFLFGVEKGRLTGTLMVMIVFGFVGASAGLASEISLEWLRVHHIESVLTVGMALIALGSTSISIPLSIRAYQHRAYA